MFFLMETVKNRSKQSACERGQCSGTQFEYFNTDHYERAFYFR